MGGVLAVISIVLLPCAMVALTAWAVHGRIRQKEALEEILDLSHALEDKSIRDIAKKALNKQ